MSNSVNAMWEAYLQSIGENSATTNKTFTAWHFCDNAKDADELAEFVKQGRKCATASSFWSYGYEGQAIPKTRSLNMITNWDGQAQCIIQTTRVDIVLFEEITEEFAWIEGEGDRSLDYWKKGHWRFFSRTLQVFGREPDTRMPVVCERFEVVFGRTV